MATKLASSLRKSLTAEKEQFKDSPAAPVAQVPDSRWADDFSENSLVTQELPQRALNTMVDLNHGVLHNYLASIMEFNNDWRDYLATIGDPHNLPQLYKINLNLFSSLQKRQRELIEKNLSLPKCLF